MTNTSFSPKSLSLLKILTLALILSIGVSYAVAAAPAGGPPNCPTTNDACNAPLHVGANTQTKAGPLWANFIASTANAYINDKLGIALGVVNGVANVPTANLDVAGTVRIRGDVTNPPAPGKVLTSSDSNGNVVWGNAGNSNTNQGWIIKSGISDVAMCYNCNNTIAFPAPFPINVIPIVTAQPRWTKDNGGEHSTWRVTGESAGGFTVSITGPSGGDFFGARGVMWTAMAKPSVIDEAACASTFSRSGSQLMVTWRVKVSDDSTAPEVWRSSANGGNVQSTESVNGGVSRLYWTGAPTFYTIAAPATVTEYFMVYDKYFAPRTNSSGTQINGAGKLLTCTVTG